MTQYKPPIKVFLYQNVKPTVSNTSETFSQFVAPVLGWMIVLHIGALVNMLSQNLLATISESTIIQWEFWGTSVVSCFAQVKNGLHEDKYPAVSMESSPFGVILPL